MFAKESDTSSIELMFLYTNRRKIKFLVSCLLYNVAIFCKLHRDMNRVNVFTIHRCINEGYGLIQLFTDEIRISPTKLWRVCNGEFVNKANMQSGYATTANVRYDENMLYDVTCAS